MLFLTLNSHLYVIRDDENNFNLKYILIVLNSNLLTWYFRKFLNPEEGKAMAQVKRGHLVELPIIKTNNEKPFIEKAEQMLTLHKELHKTSQKFQRALEREFALDSLPKKLQDWYLLSYGEFIKELEKKKVKLSLSQKAEWEDYFLQESKKALALKTDINTTDKEIDQMVYGLYGLSEEEIKIVEQN
ncbi:MAG: hypothetical protein JJE44_09920 [Flavobacteriaceae bacterium]|nr:hypothetical protein [Flavobacteriaceae bacterium]